MSAVPHRRLGGGVLHQVRSPLLPTSTAMDIGQSGAAVETEEPRPGTRHSVRQSRCSSPGRSFYRNNPYDVSSLVMSPASPISAGLNRGYSRSNSVADYNGYPLLSSGRGHAQTPSEVYGRDDGRGNVNTSFSFASMSQASLQQAYDDNRSLKYTDTESCREPLEHKPLSSTAESFAGTPRSTSRRVERQAVAYAMDDHRVFIKWCFTPPQDHSAVSPMSQHRDCKSFHAQYNVPFYEPFVHTSRYEEDTPQCVIITPRVDRRGSSVSPRRNLSSSLMSSHCSTGVDAPSYVFSPTVPSSHTPQTRSMTGGCDTSVDRRLRSPMSGNDGRLADSHTPSPGFVASAPQACDVRHSKCTESTPTAPSLDRSDLIAGFVIVKGKRQGFRYPTVRTNYIQELPVGTIVVVERDRGEAIGKVIRHISVEQVIQDYQRVQGVNEKNHPPPPTKACRPTASGKAACATKHSRVCSRSSDATDSEQSLLAEELTKVYSHNTVPDGTSPNGRGQGMPAQSNVQETLQQIVADDKNSPRILRVATRKDRRERVRRQEEQKRRRKAVADVVTKTCRSHQRQFNSATQDPEGNAADSTGVVVVDVECQLDGKKMNVYVSRKNPSIFVDFKRIVRRLHKKYKCRIEIIYVDEVAADNDDPAHKERMVRRSRQREAAKQPSRESHGAASSPPSSDVCE